LCKNTEGIGVNRNGAFAEFVTIPESNVWRHSKDIDINLAAIFDPLGNAVHTALTFPIVGEDVVITGAGPIGLMAIKIARHIGARYIVITDVKESRLELARRMGADLAINPQTESLHSAQVTLGMKEGFDIAWEMSGHHSALPEIIDNMGHGGRIALLGLPTTSIDIDWNKVVTHMLTIKGIYGREMFETWYAMTAMVKTGLDVSDVISEVIPAREWQRAFDIARQATSGKIIIDWTDL
jgi:threonine 3-dehydrogenase